MAPTPLKNYRILIVDSDTELARVLRSMLGEMGFTQMMMCSSGLEAYRTLKNEPFDFLITEWKLNEMDGIDLLRKIRRAPDSPSPTLPVIMLTGRSEQPDVFTARDLGINEFVIKPFTARTIYNRIERIIEHPRSFVVAPNFVGPDRRTRGNPPPGVADRRVRKPNPQIQPKDVHGAIESSVTPRVWLPDFTLKYKLGSGVSLDSLITPAVLSQAQSAVDAISDASMEWVKDNLNDVRILSNVMISGAYPTTIASDIGELALTINSRAGTFGYQRASEIAYMLYLFCRNQLDPQSRQHHMIVSKHIDVLQVILGNQMRGSAGALGEQIVGELKKLTGKLAA